MRQLIQGTDLSPITFQVQDDSGNLVLISDLSDYQVYVYYKQDDVKVNLFNYKKNPVGDDSSVSVIDTTTLGFSLTRQQTSGIVAGTVLYFESVIIMTFNDLKYGEDFELCQITQSPNSLGLV